MLDDVKAILDRWEGNKKGRGWTAWGTEGGYVVCLICEDGYKMKRKISCDSKDEMQQVYNLTVEATEYEEE